MKLDPTRTKLLALAIASAPILFNACDSHSHDESGSHTQGAHTSPYPACQAIIDACHEHDVGDPGTIHDCHEKGHSATSDADCEPSKDSCIAVCSAAAADAGGE